MTNKYLEKIARHIDEHDRKVLKNQGSKLLGVGAGALAGNFGGLALARVLKQNPLNTVKLTQHGALGGAIGGLIHESGRRNAAREQNPHLMGHLKHAPSPNLRAGIGGLIGNSVGSGVGYMLRGTRAGGHVGSLVGAGLGGVLGHQSGQKALTKYVDSMNR